MKRHSKQSKHDDHRHRHHVYDETHSGFKTSVKDSLSDIVSLVEKRNQDRKINVMDQFVIQAISSEVKVTCVIADNVAYLCEYIHDADAGLPVYAVPDVLLHDLLFS